MKIRASHPVPASLDIGQELGQAQAHWNAGQADQAEMLCQRVLAVWPGQSDALHLLGLMAHAYGNFDLALAHLRQACLAPRAPALYCSNLAEMCRQKGLLAEGEQVARRAVALDPTMAGAWNNLGIILQESGQLAESRQCLERVLALQPANAQAHNNLANTCKRLGLLDRAERHWSRAMALAPNYPEPYSNLANLLSEQGELDKAAELARRAIALNPQMADAHINLAAVETARGQHGEALCCLEALLAFAPQHPAGLAAHALALKQLDRLDDALDSAQRAVAASPQSDEAHNALGQVLQALGQADRALASYDHAASLPGAATEKALVNRALLFMEHGRKDQSRAAFDRALRQFPRSASAMFNSADLASFRPGDASIATMEQLLGAGGLQSATDRMLLHFALGKAYLDTGESDCAFRHLGDGNRAKRATIRYDADATSAWLTSLAETVSPAFLARLAGQGADSSMPVFVLGMPRSGTSLVEQILASHPAIHGAGELAYLQRLADALGPYPRSLADLAPGQLRRLGEAYVAQLAKLAAGRRHVVDKMPANFLYAGLIRLALPSARIIHCRRDPVDTCLSCYSKLFTSEQSFTYDLTELGRFHGDYQRLMAHWRAVLPASHFLEVDYEAVVADIEPQARRMIGFLGLAWDPACLEFHTTQRVVRTASVNQVRRPVYRSSAGRWRQHAGNLGPLLAALGVTPE
jgi:tetratricopeptide (TPR) repeat protein